MLLVLHRCSSQPAANLAWEESVFRNLSGSPRSALLFYVNAPCVVLGRGNREEEWANRNLAAADGLPILRRFSGGGTVYHDLDNLNFSFIVPKKLLDERASSSPGPTLIQRYIDFFRTVLLTALDEIGTGFSATGLSDISLNCKKVSGNAQRITRDSVLHHGTLMFRCPIGAIERYLPVPPNRPGIEHRGFVTGLREEGIAAEMTEVSTLIEASFWRALSH